MDVIHSWDNSLNTTLQIGSSVSKARKCRSGEYSFLLNRCFPKNWTILINYKTYILLISVFSWIPIGSNKALSILVDVIAWMTTLWASDFAWHCNLLPAFPWNVTFVVTPAGLYPDVLSYCWISIVDQTLSPNFLEQGL